MSVDVPIDFDLVFLDIGNRSMALDFIFRYLDLVGEQVEKIEKALAARDKDQVYRQAHAVKGGALNIHAPLLQEVAARLERVAQEGDLSQGQELHARLRQEHLKAYEYFERYTEGEKV